ncbi:MAG: epoxyqueuosine reductase, partial [Eubacteriales bacterium]
ILRSDIITRRGIDISRLKSAVIFLVPYIAGDGAEGNISLYARSLDYHSFCDTLFSRICARLEESYGKRFLGFADKSPLSETYTAACAGLGVIGDNHLLINEKYGSFVFIGEILSEVSAEELGYIPHDLSPKGCLHCGKCKSACPMTESGMDCLSAVTQKKGELTEEEKAYILKYGSAWGCDICQTSCPLVRRAIDSGVKTPIEFFYDRRINFLTSDEVAAMSDEEFVSRAFSWRGRKTILRNLALFEEQSGKNE